MMEKLLPEITAMLEIGGLKLITFTLFIHYVVCLFSDKLLFKYKLLSCSVGFFPSIFVRSGVSLIES